MPLAESGPSAGITRGDLPKDLNINLESQVPERSLIDRLAGNETIDAQINRGCIRRSPTVGMRAHKSTIKTRPGLLLRSSRSMADPNSP